MSRYLILGLACTLLFVTYAMSQAGTGTIKGVVKDKSGAALFRARVLAIETNSLHERRTQAAFNGEFSFEELPVGEYNIFFATPVTVPCFKPVMRRVELKPKSLVKLSIEMVFDTHKCPDAVQTKSQ